MTNNVSYVDLAYQILVDAYDHNGKSVPMKFLDLLKEVGDRLGYTTEDEYLELASKFYTALTIDGRFVAKENNTWVLREHEKYADVHIDMNKIYTDEDIDNADREQEMGEGDEDGREEGDDIDADDEEKDYDSAENEDDIPVTSGDPDDDENN